MMLLLPLLGRGQVTIAGYDFEATPATPTAPVTLSGGVLYSGSSASGDRPASSTFFSQGAQAYGLSSTSSATVTATVASSANIDASTYTNISVSFRLAAFSVNSSANGVDGPDFVTLEVSTDGGATYSSEIRVNGNNNAYWHYTTGSGTATRAYSGNNTPTAFAPAGGGARTTDGYSTVSVTGIASTTSLRFRIAMSDNAINERWVVDDVLVKGSAATGPVITTLSPATAAATAAATPFTVNGSGFVAGSVINFNGAALPTTFGSATQLTASIPAGTIATPGNYPVTVNNGASVSSAVNFPVTGVYYSTAASDLSDPLNFGTNTNGTGANPTSLTLPNTIYYVSGLGHTFNSAVVLGSGSKLVLQAASDVTIGSGANLTGSVDINANAMLVQQNAAPAVTFGTVSPASTVEYGQSGSYALLAADIPSTGFGNLTLRNGTKTLPGVALAIAGNLLVDNVTGFSGNVASPFTTLNLGGNLTLTGTTTFETVGTGRITVNATTTTTPQLISGNGNAVRLFRLTLLAGQAGVSLADASGGTSLELGNGTGGGGYSLATGTILNINNNPLSFFPLGRAVITTGASTQGTLAFSPGASLVFSRSFTTPLGTLLLTPGSTQLTNLTLDVRGAPAPGNTLALPNDLTVTGTLSLQNGILASGTGNLTLNGPVMTASTGLLAVGPATTLTIGGSGALGQLYTSPNVAAEVGTLTLNRAAATLRLGNSLKVSNALTLTAGTLAIGAANTLEIAGALTAAGAASPIQGSATSNLVFSGSGAVTGSLAIIPSGGNALNTLALNRTAFALIPVANTVSVGTLSLVLGALQTGPTDRIVAGTLDPTNPGNANSFVNALTLTTPNAATSATLTFPLGFQQGAYRPLVFGATQNPSATAYTARITEQNTNARGYTGSITRVSSIRYFTLTEEATSNFQLGTVTLAYGGDDGVTDNSNSGTLRVAASAGSGVPYADVDPATNPNNTGPPTAGTITVSLSAPGQLGDIVLATTSPTALVNPLPVELTSFTARRQADNAVSVKWITASEKNSAYFEVQRSANGHDFAAVATAPARGNSSQPTAYAALDKAPAAPALYYRLRQVDTDGKAAFSPVVAVAGAGTGLAAKVLLYPNPARTAINFLTEGATPYRVLNQLGQPLLHGTTQAGTAHLALDTLPPGLYFLELQTTTGRVVQKFEKE